MWIGAIRTHPSGCAGCCRSSTCPVRKSWLILAAATASLLELIASRVREYVGIDFSEEFIRAAEQRRDARAIGKGTFRCADLVEFAEGHPNHFDAAFALDFSEHLYDDQFLPDLPRHSWRAEAVGVSLSPHTPTPSTFVEHFRQQGLLKQIEGHVGVRTAGSHQALLVECGFVDVTIRYIAHYLRLGAALHRLSVLPGVGRYFQARLSSSAASPSSGDRAAVEGRDFADRMLRGRSFLDRYRWP